MFRPRIRTLIMLLCLGLGLWQSGQGSYIYAKALLAQHLITSAWEESLLAQQQTRPWPWSDTWPVARLRVPRLNIDLVVLAGDNGSSLAFGPGHRFGSAAPGTHGKTLISGHRDTHFTFLKNLSHGDILLLQDHGGVWHHYQIDAISIVDQDTPVWQTPEISELMLVTCYPFDTLVPGGPLRFIVSASKTPMPDNHDIRRM